MSRTAALRPFLALLTGAALLAAAAPVGAQGGEAKPASSARRRSATMSPPVAKRLIAAQELLQEGKVEEAKKELDALSKRRGLKPLEIANMYNMYGFIASEKDDIPAAIAYFQKAIAEDVLPLAQQYSLEYNIAQLYMMQGEYKKALRVLRSWFKKALAPGSPVTPNGSNYYMLALAYMQVEDIPEKDRLRKARKPAELAVKVGGNAPQENWLRLLGQIYFMQKEYDLLAKTLEQLIVRWPKAEYYKQLSGAYAEAGQDLKSLAVMQLAHQQGLLDKPNEYKHLAQMYLYQEIPYQAAKVLEEGIAKGILPKDYETYSLLGDAWLMARETERAFEPLRLAAERARDGETWVRLAQAYLGKEKWAEADDALGRALERGDLKDPGNVHLLRGVARMNLKRWNAARASFAAAQRYEKQARSAKQYAKYLEQRKQQAEALASL